MKEKSTNQQYRVGKVAENASCPFISNAKLINVSLKYRNVKDFGSSLFYCDADI